LIYRHVNIYGQEKHIDKEEKTMKEKKSAKIYQQLSYHKFPLLGWQSASPLMCTNCRCIPAVTRVQNIL